ncbi:MAG: 5-(carboxyamino)imidazole ribonucleotide synthase [Alphaproteobacteria bacterium]
MKTIGIIGGGQLGRMICFEAHKMGFKTVIFTDQENSPASYVTNKTIVGSYGDEKSLNEFASLVDLVTFEFENIPYEAVKKIAEKKPLYPSSEVLRITQNRILEKNFLNKIGIKTTDYLEINSLNDLKNGMAKFKKAILKTAEMGYDGKGQYVLNEGDEFAEIFEKNCQQMPMILEKFCKFECEISVIVARSIDGEIKSYEPVSNIHKNGILSRTIYPAKLSVPQIEKSKKNAEIIAKEIDLIGIMAIEYFVLDNKILVNEMAPRPHNSGHFTMDACITSQFEQLIRAISGYKLGDVRFHSRGQMINLIGSEIAEIENYKTNPKAKIHCYGKNKILEGRKMGHINILK